MSQGLGNIPKINTSLSLLREAQKPEVQEPPRDSALSPLFKAKGALAEEMTGAGSAEPNSPLIPLLCDLEIQLRYNTRQSFSPLMFSKMKG